MSCAKMAEPIEMQFGMVSWVGPGNKYITWGVDAPSLHCKGHFWECLADWKAL